MLELDYKRYVICAILNSVVSKSTHSIYEVVVMAETVMALINTGVSSGWL